MTYLDNVWYCAAIGTELGEVPLARQICDRPIVFFRTQSGEVAALEDRCAHRQAPLSCGQIVGDDIQCLYHGFMFDKNGACTHVPRQDTVPQRARIAAYPAVERWGFVWLWIGPAEAADPARIPEIPWTTDRSLRTVFFRFPVQANFQLMADNLMDVSHTDFLHRNSIGSQPGGKGDTDVPRVELESRVERDRVHFVRRVHATLLGPVSTKWAGSEKRVDRTNFLMWEPPNTIHSVLEFKNDETHRTIHLEHIMTPETATTTHYFMTWTRNFGLDNIGYPTDDDVWREQNAVVAGEDVPMVEAQQANLLRFPGVRDIPVRQDRFVTAVHNVLQGLHAEASHALPTELTRLGAAASA